MTATLICGSLTRSGDEIDERARRLAGGLARLGVDDGEVIAVMMRNDPAYVDVIQGCRLAGAYFCQVNWHFKAEEVEFIVSDSRAKVLFIHQDLLADVAHALPDNVTVISVKPHPHVIEQYRLRPPSHDEIANAIDYDDWLERQAPYDGEPRRARGHMAYTSGTTGRPKGVLRAPSTPEQQILGLRVIKQAMGIYQGVRTLVSAPLYHSAPSLFGQQTLLQGALLVLEPKFDAEATLALIEKHKIETVYLVPVMYVRLLRLPDEIKKKYDLSSLTFVASTGSPCAPEVKRRMIDWLGPVIYETYASSETGLITVMNPADAARKPGSAGLPAGSAEIRIYDDNGELCPTGEIGRVYVRQPAYADFTYQGNDAARAAIERDGFISVGDMGYLDADGFLFICDRASDMVISGGVNIYPAEIEHVLITLPGVADCAVVGIPDEEYGEALAAHVTVAPGLTLDADTIRAWLRERIAAYKVPRRIEIVASLPRDDNGKVVKRQIRDIYWSGRERRI